MEAIALADTIDRLNALLMDSGSAIWSDAYLSVALRLALEQYSRVNPLQYETVLTLPGKGREIALNTLTELLEVNDVWWPYHSDIAHPEDWPPNRVRGFRVWWDDSLPVLFLEITDGSQPQAGDQVRIFYSGMQKLKDLYGSITTIPTEDQHVLITGAAGNAALSRSLDLAETAGTDLYAVTVLGVWGRQKLREFYNMLEEVRSRQVRKGPPWGVQGWLLDKWD